MWLPTNKIFINNSEKFLLIFYPAGTSAMRRVNKPPCPDGQSKLCVQKKTNMQAKKGSRGCCSRASLR
ncbi:hypothetical protein, partial [Pantoea septica]|uniref:hypothetical protein n=1 Tax=Pantoea septica TaxID=472695 RepID=UPI0028B1AA2D